MCNTIFYFFARYVSIADDFRRRRLLKSLVLQLNTSHSAPSAILLSVPQKLFVIAPYVPLCRPVKRPMSRILTYRRQLVKASNFGNSTVIIDGLCNRCCICTACSNPKQHVGTCRAHVKRRTGSPRRPFLPTIRWKTRNSPNFASVFSAANARFHTCL